MFLRFTEDVALTQENFTRLKFFLASDFDVIIKKEWLHECKINVVFFKTRSWCDSSKLSKLRVIESEQHCLLMNKNIDMQILNYLVTYLRIDKESERMYENEWMFYDKFCKREILNND